VTLAKTVLERGGATGATVVELPIGQHVAAWLPGQIDGCLHAGAHRHHRPPQWHQPRAGSGVIAHYVLGDPMAPWFGGSASLTSEFIKKHPEGQEVHRRLWQGRGLRAQPGRRGAPVPQGLHAIEGALTGEVPLAAYTMYNEFTPADMAHFQKFFDLFSEKGIFSKRLMVDSMLYKG
jgi:NitT/TauT family transport system substrate-binding protein